MQVAPGDYVLGADPFCAGALQVSHLYIHGTLGRPRPRVIGPPEACVAVELGDLGAMSDIEIDASGGGHALGVNAFARAFRVVTGGSNGTVWVQRGGLLLDSVARGGDQVDAVATYNSVQGDNTSVINVTAIGRVHVNADTGDQAWLNVRNTVATGGFRVDCDQTPGAQGHLFLDSFFGTASTGGNCASIDQQLNSAGSGSPGLAPGDWHLLPGSALHDAGNDGYVLPADPNYGADIDGGARSAGAHVDIGADELGSALPTVGSAIASALTQTTAAVTAQIAPNGVDTGAYVEFGPTSAYGSSTPAVPAGTGFGFAAVTIPLSGLQPNALYHFRVVTTNGGIAGDDGTLQTPPFPDADSDGYPANIDCNDQSSAINPGAREVRGNNVDENCDGIAAPFRRLNLRLTIGVDVFARYTRFTALRIRRLPAGSRVRLRCRGKGCPFKRRKVSVAKGTANLLPPLRRAKLRPRTVVEIRVTAPESIGRVISLRVRQGKAPRKRTRCLPPGTTRPVAC